MKKMIFIAVAVAAVFSSIIACKNPPIFAAIEQEVKLKPASVKGFVYGIVKIGNTLYASNGSLFKKTFGGTGKWSSASAPSDRCLHLASDGTRLYAVCTDGSSFKGYVYNSGWEPIGGIGSIQFIAGTKTVFGADSNTIYVIKNGNKTGQWAKTGVPKGAAGVYCLLDTGLYNESGALITGSPTSGLKGICAGHSNSVLIFDSTNVYCYNGTVWTQKAHGVSNPQSITYLDSKQLILMSGKGGYGEIKLKDGHLTDVSQGKIVSAGSADSSIPPQNYYQYKNSVGKWYLNPICAFSTSTGYIIYTGVQDPNARYSGLWGFYHPDQIEWNRE